MKIATYNPYNGALLAEVPEDGQQEVDHAVLAARKAFDQGPWPHSSPEMRAEVLRQMAKGIKKRLGAFVKLEIQDGGATKRKAMDDVMLAIRDLNEFAAMARTFSFERNIDALSREGVSRNAVRYEPIGVCGAIIPWNFPLKSLVWKLAPALAMGNTVVIKPSELTPLSAKLMEEVIAQSGLPPGVVNVIYGRGQVTGEALAGHPLLDKLSFTGSTATGKRVMALASGNLTAVTLECGGKSANIVLEDADLELALEGTVYAAFYHAGQCCEGGTRLFLPQSLAGEFLDKLRVILAALPIGDPAEAQTRIGPLISRSQRDRVLGYIAKGKAEGATLLCGGGIPEHLDCGWFVAPTVFGDVTQDMTIAREEIFGPVLCVSTFQGEDALIDMVNTGIYGLGGGIWSKDVIKAEQLARRMRTGTVWINDYHEIHPRAPFGGYKQSGIGREFGQEGLAAYLEVKHIHTSGDTNPTRKQRFSTVLPS